MTTTISDQLDDFYKALIDALNAQYDYMPTALQNVELTAEEQAAIAYYDALGKGPGEGESRSNQPRSVRWWKR